VNIVQTRQIYIADTNHGTILLSDCEKEVISTKLFNRLHHISQNSTAYLTFPTNRTKRFEHSVGTMKLCGDIFYNSICNTSPELISTLFSKIKNLIEKEIIEKEILKKDKYRSIIEDSKFKKGGLKLKEFNEYSLKNIFYNRCIPQNLPEEHKLLYVMIFQAVRLCGLLHDIGHPPFSHITEHSMNEIYKYLRLKESSKETLTEREKQYLEIVKFYDEEEDNFQLHEKMGIKMIDKLFSQLVFSSYEIHKNQIFEETRFKIIVFELAKLIFKELEELEPIHKIISGTIDGDRLDYVNRDIENSGINNGKIEYNRLISSCKFYDVKTGDNEKIEVVYDAKTINTIEDFFMKRWYLYKNIINHHRVLKTDTILKNCIKQIIRDYLSKEEPQPEIKDNILPDDISGLWLAIKISYSNDEYFDSLIQWDDNWLITVLKKHYFKDYYEKENPVSYMLEEFLSNKKNYYSIIKNNNDFHEFTSSIEKTIEFEKIKDIELFKKEECLKSYKNSKKYELLEYLDKKIDIKKSIDDFIKLKYKDKVSDYFVVSKKIKTGLDFEPMVYNLENVYSLSVFSNVKYNLELEKSNYPYFYVYFKFDKQKSLDGKFENEILKNFLKDFGRFLAEKINKKEE